VDGLPEKRKNRKRVSQNSLVMTELGNCAACRQPFHDSGTASFFEPRVVVLTGAAPIPAGGACGGAGSPGGMERVSASEASRKGLKINCKNRFVQPI